MNLHDLEKKTVIELRELAASYEDVKGVSGMKKDALIVVLCEKLGIDRHRHLPTGIGRRDLKARIRALRRHRDQALEKHDAVALRQVRQHMKSSRRRLRRVITKVLRSQAAKPPSSE